MRRKVLILERGQQWLRRVERGIVERLKVKRVLVNLIAHEHVSLLACFDIPTFFSLALMKLLTRNLNLSSSVCTMINLKFVLGSMLPVWSSTDSI